MQPVWKKIGINLINMQMHTFYMFKGTRRHVAILFMTTKKLEISKISVDSRIEKIDFYLFTQWDTIEQRKLTNYNSVYVLD